LTKKNALKKVRVDARRQTRNKAVRSEVKTKISKAERLILAGDIKAAEAAVITAVSTLDTAVSNKVLHPNNASRRKARLMRKLNKAAAGAAAGTAE